MPISDDIKLKCFDSVMAEALGGQNVVEALLMFHEDRRTPGEIARLVGFKSRQHVEFLLTKKAHPILRRIGIWPPHWQERYRARGQRRHVPFNTLEKIHA